MKKITTYLFVVLLGLFVTACKKENACDCIKRTGDVITELRQLPTFRNVYVEDNVNVIFTEDTTMTQVTVEAGKNLIHLIRTEVVGDELRIRNDNKCNFTRRYDIPITVYVRAPRGLYHIKSKGTGLISNTNPCTSDSLDLDVESSGNINFIVDTKTCYVHQHGAGDITVRGQSNDVIIYALGTGFVTSDACPCNYSWIYTQGTGKITVAPHDLLIADVEGYGSVYYRNNPILMTTVNGTGGVYFLP